MRGLSPARVAGFTAVVAVVVSPGCRNDPQATPQTRQSSSPSAAAQPPPPEARSMPAAVEQSRVPHGYAGPLPPLPKVSYPPARPQDVVRAVYGFAARNPEVLHYVPCFCGCENQGHRGNDDCFVADRDADGKPRWEMHGYV